MTRRCALLAALVCLAACGTVATPAPGGSDAGPPACSTRTDCALFHCACRDGSAFEWSRCGPAQRCLDETQACTEACANNGGWP